MSGTSAEVALKVAVQGARQAAADVKDVGESVEEVGTQSSKAGGFLSRFTGALGDSSKAARSWRDTAKGVVAGFAGMEVVSKTTDFLKDSFVAATDDQTAQRKLAVALHNTTGATAEQSKGVGDLLDKMTLQYGVSKDDLMPAYQRLAESTGSLTKAHKELNLALNVSAGTGKSLDVVSSALMKANNGTVASLSRLGLKTKDVNGNTLTLSQSLATMAKTFHGQAEARANSFEGQQDRLNQTLHKTEVEIGTGLIPVMRKVMTFILDTGIPAVEKLTDDWKNGTGVLGTLHDNLGTIVPALGAVVAGMAAYKVASVAAAVVSKIQAAGTVEATDAQWSLNAALSANPIGLVVTGLTALAVGLIYAYKHSETFRDIVNGAFHDVAAAGKFMWNDVLKPTFNFLSKAFLDVVSAIVHGAADAFGWVPGLGGKLKAAATAVDGLQHSLDRLHSKNVDVTINAKVKTQQVQQSRSAIGDYYSSITGSQVTLASPKKKGKRATGGPVYAAGSYLVGENGPELFTPSSSGTILPRNATLAATAVPTYKADRNDWDDAQLAGVRPIEVNLNLFVDGKQMTDVVVNQVKKKLARA